MKYILIFLLAISFSTSAQQIGTNRLKDGAVTQPKLADDALRPVDSGVLSDYELVFGTEYRKKYSLTVNEDIPLTLSASTQTADSYIYISTIPNGSNVVTFPSDWSIEDNEVFDPTQTQRIELYYDGNKVYVEIFNADPIVISALTTAEVVGGTDDITLTFNNPVTITTAGWSFTASGGAVTASSIVSGSGTTTIVMDLSRNITAGEDMTISYDPATGATTSLTGNEIAVISNQIVETGDEDLPVNGITVCASGCDYTTGQAASNAATAGQTVLFRTGTYRETIVAKAGVIYQNYPGETATISGLELAGDGGWTSHDLTNGRSIYKKTISINGGNLFIDNNNTNTTLHAIQIFKDGVMQHLARYPNAVTVPELLDRTKLRQRNQVTAAGGSWSGSQINDPGHTSALTTGNWTGGKIWITGWYIARTGNITAHSGNTITFTNGTGNDNESLKFQQYYYLTGKIGALDVAKEWHYESGILYFWQTGGGSPTGVEYKARNWGFDVRGKANVIIKGLTFIGCDPIQADLNSTNTMVDGIRASYTNHAYLLTGGGDLYTNARRTGLQIIGPGSTLKNSEIIYAASQGVWLGQSCIMNNNKVTYINYEGNYGAGVNFWNPGTGNQLITRNEIAFCGRSAVDFSEAESEWELGTQTHLNMEISYNDIHDNLMLSSDGGQFYGSVHTDITGCNVHHNWIYDCRGALTPTAGFTVGVNAGFYLDQASGPVTFWKNVLWNNSGTDFHTQQVDSKRDAGKNWLIGNTFSSRVETWNNQVSYLTVITTRLDYQRNNIYMDNVWINFFEAGEGSAPGDVNNSIRRATNPVFVGGSTFPVTSPVADPESYFSLQAGSPGVNTGTVITGQTPFNIPDLSVFTADAVGTPDKGAYEFGGEVWIPGYNSVAPDDDVYIEDNNLTFTQYTTTPTTFSNSAFHGGTASFFGAASGTITINITGTAFEWYAEKSSNQGIIEIRVDGVRQDCDTGTGGTQDCDNYAATSANNSTLIFSKTGMSAGSHEIEIETTGTKNASSTDFHVVHDAIKITAQ